MLIFILFLITFFAIPALGICVYLARHTQKLFQALSVLWIVITVFNLTIATINLQNKEKGCKNTALYFYLQGV